MKNTQTSRSSWGLLVFAMIASMALGAASCAEEAPDELGTTRQELNAPPNLLAWWGGDGSSVKIGGSGANFAIVYDGADYTTGKVAQAFRFDGKNYATLGSASNRIDLASAPGFTLAAWVKRDGGTAAQSIMDERDASRHFEWYVNGAGKVFYSVHPSPLTSTTSVNDNQWHFVAISHAKTTTLAGNPAGTATLYVDGVPQSSALNEYSRTGYFTSVNGFALTRRSDPGIDLDEPMIYGRALSSGEIADLYNAGPAGIAKPSDYPVCGNGAVDTNDDYGNKEECDDGNLANGDGCSTVCKTEHAVRYSIVSLWGLDANGNWALDSVGGNTAQITSGSVWDLGPPGFSMAGGPGTDNVQSFRVNLPDRPNQHFAKNPFTIALWVNVRSSISLNHRWVEKLNLLSPVSPRSPDGYQCCGDIKLGLGGAGNDIVFQAGRVNDHDVHATAPILGAGWKHVTAVREANGTLKIYVDCQLKASRLNVAAIEPVLNVTNRGQLVLGSGQGSQLDQVTFFDRALSGAEICAVKDGTYIDDLDNDVVADAEDNCVQVWNQDQADIDGDGAGDACDQCPDDPDKTEWGICGCNASDTLDTDGDETLDCFDSCPEDPNKVYPGTCGCGVAQVDNDHDRTWDCIENCALDSDGDGIFDCQDQCNWDPSDADSDGDGVPDCADVCWDAPDTDSDGDGRVDCIDGCPSDPLKTYGGWCGCGVAESDADHDWVPDCWDACPTDPTKQWSEGACGCGVPDIDNDFDGVPDCGT